MLLSHVNCCFTSWTQTDSKDFSSRIGKHLKKKVKFSILSMMMLSSSHFLLGEPKLFPSQT